MINYLKNLYKEILKEKKDNEALQKRINTEGLTTNINCYLGIQGNLNLPYFSIESDKKSFINFKEHKTIGIETKNQVTKNKDRYTIFLKNQKYLNNFYYLLAELLDLFSLGKNKAFELKNFQIKLDQWIVFLKNNKSKKLSLQELIGLFGELFILESLLDITDDEMVLFLWKGPFDRAQDFENNNKFIEVKTSYTKQYSTVHISSEHQLDYKDKDLLFLCNVMLDEKKDGINLKQLIERIRKRFNPDNKKFFIQLLEALRLDLNNLKLYEEKFILNTIHFYNIENGFPFIISSKLDQRITKVKYELDLYELNKFSINKNKALEAFLK